MLLDTVISTSRAQSNLEYDHNCMQKKSVIERIRKAKRAIKGVEMGNDNYIL